MAIHGCTSCGGRFLTFDALRTVLTTETNARSEQERVDAMAAAGTAATAPGDARPSFGCPQCGETMRRFVHQYASGVWVDACDEHGVWLDAGELERLEAYAEAVARGAVQAPSSHVSPRRPPIAERSDDLVDVEPFDVSQLPGAIRRAAIAGAVSHVLGPIGFVAVELVEGVSEIPDGVDSVGRGVRGWRHLGGARRREDEFLEQTKRELGRDPDASGG